MTVSHEIPVSLPAECNQQGYEICTPHTLLLHVKPWFSAMKLPGHIHIARETRSLDFIFRKLGSLTHSHTL